MLGRGAYLLLTLIVASLQTLKQVTLEILAETLALSTSLIDRQFKSEVQHLGV